MVVFLSPEWIAALDAAARADADLAAATADVSLVVEQRVTRSNDRRTDPLAGRPTADAEPGEPEPGEHDDAVVFHVTFANGAVSVAPGPAPSADVRFTQDLDTAWGVAAGTESAQRAFMTGGLQVGGDLQVLLEHQEVLSGLGDVFASVRARTEPPPGLAEPAVDAASAADAAGNEVG